MSEKYSKIRDSISEGSVVFFKSTGFAGKLIGTFTQSQFSHVGIVVHGSIGKGGKTVLLSESNEKEGSTRVVPLSAKLPFAVLRAKKNILNKEAKELCFKIAGTSYAYDYLFWRMLGMSPELSETHKYCSVHVAGILKKCGFSEKKMIKGGRSPGEMMEVLQLDNRFEDLTWVI